MRSQLSEDYISVLNVRPGASHAECRAAYIALAKKWHPDRNSDPEASANFTRLSVAYAASVQATSEKSIAGTGDRAAAKILRCRECSGKVAIPRRAEFVGVLSVLVWSKRWSVSGIFCPRCARSIAFKTTTASVFLGWWSVQGIFLAPLSVINNIRGGRQDKTINFKLSCHNLIALAEAGDVDGAMMLARHIVSEGNSLPLTVARLVSSLGHQETCPPEMQRGKREPSYAIGYEAR
jgi:hypothetical protein